MSYAQVIVSFTDMPSLDMSTYINTYISTGLSRYAILTGYPSWSSAAQVGNCIPNIYICLGYC